MYLYVRGINIHCATVSTIFLLNFGIVQFLAYLMMVILYVFFMPSLNMKYVYNIISVHFVLIHACIGEDVSKL